MAESVHNLGFILARPAHNLPWKEDCTAFGPCSAIFALMLRSLRSTRVGHCERPCFAESIPAACNFTLLSTLPPRFRQSTMPARFRQIATMRMPPRSIARSPTLNRPRRAWSARNGNRVWDVAARHNGLLGCSVERKPTTGIVPALASVTRAFRISPESISKAPARTQGDRTARITSHRIAQHSHSQIVGCCVHANWCTAERTFTVYPTTTNGDKRTGSKCGCQLLNCTGRTRKDSVCVASNQANGTNH